VETKTPLPAESGHWYALDGSPTYEVERKDGEGMRPATLADARKISLVPSVTMVLNCIAKPGLEAWKARNVLEASLTLPREPGEPLDVYAKRVIEDAKAQSVAAAERGTALHTAIEKYVAGYIDRQWEEHLMAIKGALIQHGIDLHAGETEHSFATSINGLWYGGKVDFHTNGRECVICDFKSKDKIENGKRLAWDEHAMQLAAYGFGLFQVVSSSRDWKCEPFRALNVFVGVNDCAIRVVEHEPKDVQHGFELFQSILDYWSRKNRFGKYS
jgi:hypothetical protein